MPKRATRSSLTADTIAACVGEALKAADIGDTKGVYDAILDLTLRLRNELQIAYPRVSIAAFDDAVQRYREDSTGL